MKIVSHISDIAARIINHGKSDRDISRLKHLKCLMIQGGGKEHQYDVPLINGVDVLVCATPLILLRMLGTSKTNMERMQYMVLDEAHLLLEKYAKKIFTLFDCLFSLIKINDEVPIAQFILMSSSWSHQLRAFVDKMIHAPTIITTNKLEASFLGECLHLVRDVGAASVEVVQEGQAASKSSSKGVHKLKMLSSIVQEHLCQKSENTIVFVNTVKNIPTVVDYLKRHVFAKYKRAAEYLDASLNVVTTATDILEVAEIEKKWKQTGAKGLLLVG
jgi:superfamily II DNA/RNA helicase